MITLLYLNHQCLFIFIDLKLKKFELALDDLREVIEKDPKNVKAHFRRGSCFKEISMYCLVSIMNKY